MNSPNHPFDVNYRGEEQMLDGFGSLGIDNWPRMTLTLFLLASPPNAASGKRNVMQKFTMIRLFTAVAGCWLPFQKSYLVAE